MIEKKGPGRPPLADPTREIRYRVTIKNADWLRAQSPNPGALLDRIITEHRRQTETEDAE